MLSILIPVHNQNVCSLVSTLKKQAKELGVRYEIILIDDASEESSRKANRCLSREEDVSYIELPGHEGRAAVRNMLAETARYPYLLFIDGDAGVAGPAFLRSYLDQCPGEGVVCGGTAYRSHRPDEVAQRLRWTYGRRREMIPAARRSRHPYASFSAFNFMASASVMKKVRFDESLVRYGHEDTLFGYHLAKERIRVKHIDNPLLHEGLDKAEVFLVKTRDAARTLASLSRQYRLDRDFDRPVSLLRTYHRLGRSGLLFPMLRIYSLAEKQAEANLLGAHPSLFLFQAYKLYHFHKALEEEGKTLP